MKNIENQWFAAISLFIFQLFRQKHIFAGNI